MTLHNQAMFDRDVEQKVNRHAESIQRRIDQLFAILMPLQWIAGIAAALFISPRTWIGAEGQVHPHVMFAIVGGAILCSLPVGLAIFRPGRFSTRMVIACSQVLFSSLLINLTGGRIETHFHVFGSLAFLAAYRDWRVLVPATVIVAVDHFLRGVWWPQTVFGIATAENWRWIEHAGWVVFEDVFLLLIIRQCVLEMRETARQATQLENNHAELRQYSNRLVRSIEKERAVVERALDGIVEIDRRGTITGWNPQAETIFGWSAAEALGQTLGDLVVPPQYRQAQAEGLRRYCETGHGPALDKRLELEALHRDGHTFPIEIAITPIHQGEEMTFCAFMQDISTRKQAESALKSSEAQARRLALVASHASYGVIIADRDGRAEWVNDGLSQMTGYSASEIVGKEPWTFLQGSHTDPDVAKHLRQQLERRESMSAELINYRKDGRTFWTSLKIEPVFNDEGELRNFISTQTNVSDRKAREAELRRAKEESESANRAKSQFLANMSHEIRTPLNGILGFTELLRRAGDGIASAERREHLSAISSSGRHLLTLINDILDISKIEAGQLQVERVRCSPHQIIAEAVSILRVPAREKGISLDYRWESGIPESIESDPLRLKQLLMNLLGNAIKFTEQGSVLVVASLEADNDSPRLRFEVRDTGMGIPREKLEMIFEPFAQADSSVTRKHGGTGLGLAISRRIAEALGGQLRVDSEIGRGSTFTATVATGDLSAVTILDKPPQEIVGDMMHQETAGNSLAGLKILIVEDGDTNRKLLQVTLARSGASTTSAENGKMALHLAGDEDFDLILMDMQMPIMDGYTAARILRDRGFTKPIIALTAHAMKGDREKCEEAGCSGYLTKPINPDTLVQTILQATKGTARVARPAGSSPSDTSTTTAGPIRSEVRSSLPVDDPEIGAIVREFVDKLPVQIESMDAASTNRNYVELAKLAHWLKGAGGTVGFDCFTDPAKQLEQFAKEGKDIEIGGAIQCLRSLQEMVVVP